MFELRVREQPLPNVYLLDCPHYTDTRGSFTKIFHEEALKKLGLCFKPAEFFLSRSSKGVLRGMHFQTGTAEQEKIVYCLKGRVLDVIVDIRASSVNFNKPISIELCEHSQTAIFIGKGYAHGFVSLEDESIMIYQTSTIHQPEFDAGVLWSSIDFDWPIRNPLISARDSKHPPIFSNK